MSLNYGGLLKELEDTVHDYYKQSCKDIGISSESQCVTVEALEKSKNFEPFNNGMAILLRAMTEYKYFRYLHNNTLDELNNYLFKIRQELSKEQHAN